LFREAGTFFSSFFKRKFLRENFIFGEKSVEFFGARERSREKNLKVSHPPGLMTNRIGKIFHAIKEIDSDFRGAAHCFCRVF